MAVSQSGGRWAVGGSHCVVVVTSVCDWRTSKGLAREGGAEVWTEARGGGEGQGEELGEEEEKRRRRRANEKRNEGGWPFYLF